MRLRPAPLVRSVIGRAGVGCLLATVVFAALAIQAPAAGADALSWAPGVVVAPPANAGTNPDAVISSLSCPAAGSCAAIGSYQDASGETQGLLATETGGQWRAATEAQLPNNAYPANPDVSLTSVACASAGNCTAVGSYLDVHGYTQGLLLSEVNGSWAQGKEVIHPVGASVASNPQVKLTFVSCATAGNCFVAGSYSDSSNYPEGLLETEVNGVWYQTEKNGSWSYTGIEATLPAGAGAEPHVAITSGSCGAVGTCVAVGTYVNSAHEQQGLLLNGSQSGGTWTFTASTAGLPAGAAANPSVSLNSVSCPAAASCEAVGSYEDADEDPQGLLLTETAGAWQTGTAPVLPGDAATDPAVSLTSVSCPSAGNCDAVGDYDTAAGSLQGLMLTQTAGAWQPGAEPTLPADAGSTEFVTLSAVSCSTSSGCAAVGNYADDSFFSHPLLLSQSTDGSWSAGIEPALAYPNAAPNAYVEAIACAATGDCSAIADYTDAAGDQLAGAISGTPDAAAGTSLSLAAPPAASESGLQLPAGDLSATLSGGAGASGTVTFTVFGPQSSPPSSCAYGGTTLSTALVSGNGPYASTSGFTPASPGDYWWFASYGGDLANAPSASPCGTSMAETIVTATPALTLTAAPTATVAEAVSSPASARLLGGVGETGTVTFTVVGPQASPPVSCSSSGRTLGTATVKDDGDYTPAASFTPSAPGTYWWYAKYSGDATNDAASSPCGAQMPQTVVAGPPVTNPPVTNPPVTITVTQPPPTSPVTHIADLTASGNVLRVTLTCSAASSQSCVSVVSVTVTEPSPAKKTAALATRHAGERVLTIATATFKVNGGISRQVSIRLNRAGTVLLASRRRLSALLRLRQGQTVLRRTVTLRVQASAKRRQHA